MRLNSALVEAVLLQSHSFSCFPSQLLLLFVSPPVVFAGGYTLVPAWHLNSLVLINPLEGGCCCCS